jgi:hypothetical protein
VRLQVGADRDASKHLCDSHNRGKAGPPTLRPRRRTVVGVEMHTFGEWEVRGHAEADPAFTSAGV